MAALPAPLTTAGPARSPGPCTLRPRQWPPQCMGPGVERGLRGGIGLPGPRRARAALRGGQDRLGGSSCHPRAFHCGGPPCFSLCLRWVFKQAQSFLFIKISDTCWFILEASVRATGKHPLKVSQELTASQRPAGFWTTHPRWIHKGSVGSDLNFSKHPRRFCGRWCLDPLTLRGTQVYWGSEGRPTEGPFREPAFSPISSTNNNKHSCEKSACGCWRLGLCLHQGWPWGDHTGKQTLSSEHARVCWTQALCPGNTACAPGGPTLHGRGTERGAWPRDP